MRPFRPVHLILLIGAAVFLLWPMFTPSKGGPAGYLMMNIISTVAGVGCGLVGSVLNFRRGKPLAGGFLNGPETASALLSVVYWIITGACVGGSVGWIGWLVIVFSATAAIATLVLMPLMILVVVLPFVVPFLADGTVLWLIARLD